MITTTTHAIEGRQITAYLDIVSAESVQGVNVIRDMFAGMRDFFRRALSNIGACIEGGADSGH